MLSLILLIMIITFPLLIPMFFVAIFFGGGGGLSNKLKKALTLHADKGLSEQGLLWLSIFTPLMYAIFFGIIVWSGHSILLTEDGLSNFVRISAFPLALISLSLPLSILVSRLHSTKQTAEQIKITRAKNNIDLFNSHRKDLFSYFSQIGEVNYLDCIQAKYKLHPKIHKIFFKGTPLLGTPVFCSEAFEDIESELSVTRQHLHSIITNANPSITYSLYIANFSPAIYRLSLKLGIPEIYIDLADKSVSVPFDIKGGGRDKFLTAGRTTDEAIAAFRYIRNFFSNLCDFAGYEEKYTTSESIKYIDEGLSYRVKIEPPIIENIHLINIPVGNVTSK